MDLNADVQLLILENLNLSDLLSVAQTNRQMYSLAANVFQRKYSKKMVLAYDPHADQHNHNNDTYFRNFEMISKILKYFGALISHLKIVYKLDTEYTTNISTKINSIHNLINLHCSETLVHFQIDNFYEVSLDKMTKPFINVEKFTIRGRLTQMSSSSLAFDELFPALRELYLPFLRVENKKTLEINLPHLEHISIGTFAYSDPSRFTEASVQHILRKNPQIRSVELSSSDQFFLKIINENVPNLEMLELKHFSPSSVPIDVNFKMVKTLKIYSTWSAKVPENVIFENLRQLHLEGFVYCINRWAEELLKTNKHLNRLYLDRGCIGSGVFETLKSATSNIAEISLTFCARVDDESIIQFLRDSPNLKKITFNEFQSGRMENISHALWQEFGDEWKINERMRAILIERRN